MEFKVNWFKATRRWQSQNLGCNAGQLTATWMLMSKCIKNSLHSRS